MISLKGDKNKSLNKPFCPHPASGLDHFEFKRVTQLLSSQQGHGMAAGQASEHVARRQETWVRNQFSETAASGLHHPPHIQTFLCQRACLENRNNKVAFFPFHYECVYVGNGEKHTVIT